MKQSIGMTLKVCAAALSLSIGTTQVFAQTPQNAQTPAPVERTPASPASTELTVPAGTVVPLTLVNVITAKSTPLGGTVRASVAFPVTVGTRLAIPAGVFVEGQLVQVHFPKGYKAPKGAPPVSPLKVHFTKLIYPNGYTVMLDAEVSALKLDSDGTETASLQWPALPQQHGPSGGSAFLPYDAPQQQATVTDPYEHAGPNPAVIYGPIIGAAVITTAIILAARHHVEPLDMAIYDAGYQLQMTLATPLVLDRSKIGKIAEVPDPSQP